MPADSATRPTARCLQCGGALLGSGPNAGCPRCALAIAVDTEDIDSAEVEVLFPELRIKGLIARGGFGSVYSAEHKMLKRRVALKFLDPSLAHSRDVVERFGKEMEAVGRLDHPGIVRAHDAGERDGHWFIVMEFVDGEDLASISRRSGPMDAAHACRIVRQAALALAYAHGRGLVHRDVKPSNIMLATAPDGGETIALSPVKVLDFGLAELGAEAPEGSERVFRGTPDYAAPELIETPDDVDVRADVFGLGATLFRLLTSRAPHALGGEESLIARMQRRAITPPPPVATLRSDLPAGLAAVCDRMLAMDRNARPATAAEVAELLAPFAGEKQRPSRRRWWLAAAAISVCLGALAWNLATPDFTPLLTPKEAADLALDEAATPRIYSRDWALESIIVCERNHRGARFMRDGSILAVAFRDAAGPQATIWKKAGAEWKGEPVPQLGFRRGSWRAYIAPDSGHVLTTDPNYPEFCRLTRYTPDLAEMPSLHYSDKRFSSIESLAFVRPGAVPKLENSGLLSEGDILVADSGRGDFRGRGSLWRCRLDNDEPLQLLVESDVLSAPVDVTIGRGGIHVFNRNAGYGAGDTVSDVDFTQRVIRWDGAALHPCTLNEPVRDPSGMVADPQSTALFAAEGSSVSGGGPGQRLLRFVSGEKPDSFTVEVIADRFGQLASGALAISEDGNRILLCDNALARIFVLVRR